VRFNTLIIFTKRIFWHLAPGLFRRVVAKRTGQRFSIGIMSCDASLKLSAPAGLVNPVLTGASVTDIPADFVADPFIFRTETHWCMYFEAFNLITRLGEIGLALSPDGIDWRYEKIVLSEPFHLAYPGVFTWNGGFYMIPDTPDNGVRLYRADSPTDPWYFVRTLLEGKHFSDSTVFEYSGRWWMFSAWISCPSNGASLKLYSASEPTGDWREHRLSPLISNDRVAARPAGPVVEIDGRLIRFAQDGVPEYGSRVRAFEVSELNEESYLERELVQSPLLSGSGSGWNADGMHHVTLNKISENSWLASVDGWYVIKHDER